MTAFTKVPAEPCRERLLKMRADGITMTEAAAALGVHANTLYLILNGHNANVSAYVASKILGDGAHDNQLYPKGSPPPGAVDAIGATRRLRALAFMGWASSDLAEQLGWELADVAAVLNADVHHLPPERATQIADVYDKHWLRAGPSMTMRELAISSAWAGPLAWDDDTIDDRAARPEGTRERRTIPRQIA